MYNIQVENGGKTEFLVVDGENMAEAIEKAEVRGKVTKVEESWVDHIIQ